MDEVNDVRLYQDLGLARKPEPSRKKELGQEDFLKLMVTELRNQDPFKPMKSGDFLGQIAQFGAVSGISSLEKKFTGLAESLVSNQALQAATLVNSSVMVATDVGPLPAGGSLRGAVDLPFAADRVRVGIYDSAGGLVRQFELGANPPGAVRFAWDGVDKDGRRLSPGLYEIRAEATSGPVTQAVETSVADTVESVNLGRAGDPLSVRLKGLGAVDFKDIKQIG